jgi:predicted PurR-regulated permease PerM
MGWRSQDILRTAALVVGFYVLIRLLWFASPLVLTAFLGVLFGLAVEAGVDRLERWRIPRGIGAAGIVLGFFGLLFLVGAWMAPTLREQSRELRTKLPEAIDKVEAWVNQRRTGVLGIVFGRPAPAAAVGGTGSDTAARGDTAGPRAPSEVGGVAPSDTSGGGRLPGAQTPSPTETIGARLTKQVTGVSRYLFPFVTTTITVIAGLLLITFLAIYIAAEPDKYHGGLMHLFPHRSRKRAGEVLSAMALVLRKWLVTQLIAMASIGVITTIALLILDVRAAFALGVIAGLLEFVPTIGPILSAIPAIAMGFVDSPEKALYVLLVYVVVQFFENHVLIPNLMKEVDLPPAVTIMAQALMALVFGFLGLLVAVPLVAAIMVPIKMLYVEDVVGDEVEILEEDT